MRVSGDILQNMTDLTILSKISTPFTASRPKSFPIFPTFFSDTAWDLSLPVFISAFTVKVLPGAIIMGTGNQPPALAFAGSKLLANVIALIKGDKYRSQFLNRLAFGAYNTKFRPARTPYDWLTKDTHVVDAYMKGP